MPTTYTFTLHAGLTLVDAKVTADGVTYDVDALLVSGYNDAGGSAAAGSIVTLNEALAQALKTLRAGNIALLDVNGVPGGTPSSHTYMEVLAREDDVLVRDDATRTLLSVGSSSGFAGGEGGPEVQDGRHLLVPYTGSDARVGVPAGDHLHFPDLSNEAKIIEQGGSLYPDGDNQYYTDPAQASKVAQIVPGSAPGRSAIRPPTVNGGGARVPIVLPADEFTIVVRVRPRGADLTALGGGARSIFQVDGGTGPEQSESVRLFFNGNNLVVRVALGGRGAQSPVSTGNIDYSVAVAAGDFPADQWRKIRVTYNGANDGGVNDVVAQFGVEGAIKSTVRAGGSYPAWAFFDWGRAYLTFGAFNSVDEGLDIEFEAVRRYSQHPSLYAAGGYPRYKKAPQITVDAGATVKAYPTKIAGVITFPTTLSNYQTAILNAFKDAGCPFLRTPEMSPAINITALGTLGNNPTIDWTTFDAQYARYGTLGIPIQASMSYTPAALQEGGDGHKPPFAGTSMSALAKDQYARALTMAYDRLANHLGANVVSLTLWNEPEAYSTGFTPTTMADLWQAVAARLAAAYPSAPLLAGPDGQGDDLANIGTASGYAQSIIARALANGITLPAVHAHLYPTSPAEWLGYIDSIAARCTTLGLPVGTPLRLTEWSYDLGWGSLEHNNSPHSVGHLRQRTMRLFEAAFAFASIASMASRSRVDAAAYASDRSVTNYDTGLFGQVLDDTRSDPRPNPVFGAFQALWKHGGNQIASSVNWPGLYALASRNGNTVTLTYGSFREGDLPPGGGVYDLRWDNLPGSLRKWKHWRLDQSTHWSGRLPLVGQGDIANLPTSVELGKLGVGAIQLTEA